MTEPTSKPATGRALAALIGGDFTSPDLIWVDGHVIACRPTGRVVFDNTYQLGRLSDGAEYLADRYRAAAAGMAVA